MRSKLNRYYIELRKIKDQLDTEIHNKTEYDTLDEYNQEINDLNALIVKKIKTIHEYEMQFSDEITDLPFSLWENYTGKKQISKISVEEFINIINDNPYKDDIIKARQLGKNDENEIYKAFGRQSNFYNHIKSKCYAVTPSISLIGNSTMILDDESNIEHYTKILYFDIDVYKGTDVYGDPLRSSCDVELIDKSSTLKVLDNTPFVGEYWDSFGGEGIGMLCYVTGYLMKDNYYDTWKKIERYFALKGIQVDKQTNNPNRLNIVSYSEVKTKSVQPLETDVLNLSSNTYRRLYATESDLVSLSEYADIKSYLTEHINKTIDKCTDGYRNKPIGILVRFYILRAGISKEIALQIGSEMLINNLDLREYKRQIEYQYKNYKKEFGMNPPLKTTVNLKELKVKNNYELNKETQEKLSDLNLKFKKKTVLISPTGSGKTYNVVKGVSNTDKRILLLPTQAALKQIQGDFSEKDIQVYYEKQKNVNQNSTMILTTYSSFKRLFPKSGNNKVNPNSYTLYIDEWHNLAFSSKKDYRGYDLNYILDRLHLFKNVVGMTGTYFDIKHPALNDFEIVKVKWSNPIDKIYSFGRYTEFDYIKYDILEKLIPNKINLIFFNNAKWSGGLGIMEQFFSSRGKKVLCINSNTKNQSEHELLVTEGKINDYDIVITTSILIEASSIYNTNIGNLFIVPNKNDKILHPLLCEQLANRFRKKNPNHIYSYIKKYKENKRVLNIYNSLLHRAEKESFYYTKSFDRYKNPSNSKIDNMIDKIIYKLINKEDFHRISSFNNVMTINYLSIANEYSKIQTNLAPYDINFIVDTLKEYNWRYKGEYYIKVPDHIVSESEIIEQRKSLMKSAIDIYIQKIMGEGVEVNKNKINTNTYDFCERAKDKNPVLKSNLKNIEELLRLRYDYISKIFNQDDITDIFTEIKDDSNKYSLLKKQIEIQKIIQHENFNDLNLDHKNNLFMYEMIKFYDKHLGTPYTIKEFIELLKPIFLDNAVMSTFKFTSKSTVTFLRYFFKVSKRKQMRYNKLKKKKCNSVVYLLESNNPLEGVNLKKELITNKEIDDTFEFEIENIAITV